MDENEPIVDETVIEDVLQASLSQSQKLCKCVEFLESVLVI